MLWARAYRSPLHNPLESEVSETVGEAFLPELHILLAGRAREQHGRSGGVLSPTTRVRSAHWGKRRMQVCRKEQGEREETLKELWKKDVRLQKFAEDGGNVCEGQEQNPS